MLSLNIFLCFQDDKEVLVWFIDGFRERGAPFCDGERQTSVTDQG